DTLARKGWGRTTTPGAWPRRHDSRENYSENRAAVFGTLPQKNPRGFPAWAGTFPEAIWNASPMPAHVKLRGRRERRLLALLSFGDAWPAACGAVDIAPQTVTRRRRADPIFAEAVRVARANRAGAIAPELPDWRVIAAQLEAEYPERWSLG